MKEGRVRERNSRACSRKLGLVQEKMETIHGKVELVPVMVKVVEGK